MVGRCLLSTVVIATVVIAVMGSGVLAAQQIPAVTGSASVKEFPVTLKQEVTAGKTAVGTKVQAKLTVATLVDGTVFPKNTIFSGEVTESKAQSADSPSRIGIRMDSAQWKNGSAPIKVYLTAWFYPMMAARGQDLSYGPPQSPTRTWNGAGTYPDPNSPASQPFPNGDTSGRTDAAPEAQVYALSKQRVLMRDVEPERSNDGALAITSRSFNLKLDKMTTYVLATGELPAATSRKN
jgi:hypothetical protein